MKILVIVSDHGTGELGLGYLYAKAFSRLGHEVHLLPVDPSPVHLTLQGRALARLKRAGPVGRYWSERLETELVKATENYRPDLTIVFRCERLSRDSVSALRSYTRHAVWNVYNDSPLVIPGIAYPGFREALGAYDAVLTAEPFAAPIFYQLGARHVEWLPFAHDPEYHHPGTLQASDATTYGSPVAYLGTYGPLQTWWLTPLVPLGLKIWGNGWFRLSQAHLVRACWKPGLGQGPELWKPIAGAKVVFNMCRAEHMSGHSMKTFEIPSCGGLMVSNRTETQMQFFKDRKEAVFYDTREEAVDLIRFYIEHDSERERIREAGMRAVAHHTYESRAKTLLEYLSVDKMPSFF